MPEDLLLDFLSKSCKANIHRVCAGRWQGIGLEVYCYCCCHINKEKDVLEVSQSTANTVHHLSPSRRVYNKDDNR